MSDTAPLNAENIDPAMRLEGVTKVFPNGAGVHDVTFDVAKNSVTAVIGPNGSGKTVVFSLMTGLLPLDAGTIHLDPTSNVAYCPDVPQFEYWLNAVEVVENSIAMAMPQHALDPLVALDMCGLARVRDRRVSQYSRGMLQRLGIACALALNPDVLILDEPSSALDPIGKSDIARLITEQRADRTIVLSSHSLSEVEKVADQVVVIDEGCVVDQGSTADILSRGVSPTWDVRLGAGAQVDTSAVAQLFPRVHIHQPSPDTVRLSFESFEAAADQLHRVIGALNAPVMEVLLAERDLDAAFARIVAGQRR